MGKHFLDTFKNTHLSKDTNLWSLMTLQGAIIEAMEAQAVDVAKEKIKLLDEICKPPLQHVINRAREIINEWSLALIANGYRVKVCEVEAVSRVIVGASEDFGRVPFEVGLFFDPIFNVPFIPGSSLKGALRYAFVDLVERKYGRKDAEKLANEVFGSKNVAGLVGVSDAYPVSLGISGRLFEPDVVTPHYSFAATELDVKPNPVPFLTIAPGVRFRFLIFFNKEIYGYEHELRARVYQKKGGREVAKLGTVDSEKLGSLMAGEGVKKVLSYAVHFDAKDLGEAMEKRRLRSVDAVPWIDRAILYAFARGVGAKTSLGYSRFKLVMYKAVGKEVSR